MVKTQCRRGTDHIYLKKEGKRRGAREDIGVTKTGATLPVTRGSGESPAIIKVGMHREGKGA